MHKCMVRISKTFGNIFVFFLLFILGLAYYQLVIQVWGPTLIYALNSIHRILPCIILFIWHFFVIMFIWSLAQTLITDPGRVPIYWVIFFDNKRDFTWEIQKTNGKDIVWCAMYLNQIDAIIVLHAIDVFWIWIIIVLGLIIALDSGIESFSFYFYSMQLGHCYFLQLQLRASL